MTALRGDGGGFSLAARTVWAKSVYSTDQVPDDNSADEKISGWLPLYQHLDDTAAVAGWYWDNHVSDKIKDLIAQPSLSHAEVRSMYVWLAGVHDVGKASPAFAIQVDVLAQAMIDAGLPIDRNIKGTPERSEARHEVVGYLHLSDRLVNNFGYAPEDARQLAGIVAAHHGLAPEATRLSKVRAEPHLVGDGVWAEVRTELFARAEQMHLPTGQIESWRDLRLPITAQTLLSGLVIVADWIASNEEYFPYCELNRHPGESTQERLDQAIQELRLSAPWKPAPPSSSAETFFQERFTLPPNAKLKSAQKALVDAARQAEGPELFIVEAPMGSGKTEAALAAAEILAAKTGANGIYFGLPTQATADGMFSRVLPWIERLGGETANSVYLAHGKANLNAEFSRLSASYLRSLNTEPGATKPNSARGTLDDAAVAHQWFRGKRGMLATFVVGTIDQGLMGVLRSRHVVLRHLGLASKVVIIDEAHSYDAYSSVYLEQLLHWLGGYQVPVILLSATLPAAKRQDLIKAYDRGRSLGEGNKLSKRQMRLAEPTRYQGLVGNIGYPSVAMSRTNEAPLVIAPADDSVQVDVVVEQIDDSPEAILQTLKRELAGGGCAAVIHNTVRRVQETAAFLRVELDEDVEIIVAHSRFVAADRAVKDAELLKRFGAPGLAPERPKKSVVVASQVIEQSLDIDFDVMITDLAPIDLVLQRSGRLHRHDRGDGRPERVRAPRLFLTGVDWRTEPPEPAKAYRKIYQPFVLLRTLAVLADRAQIQLPRDIPLLVQRVYDDEPIGPDSWQSALAGAKKLLDENLRTKQGDARAFRLRDIGEPGSSLIGWVQASVGDAESAKNQAAVRDIGESLEVLVLFRDSDGVLKTLPWLAKNAGVAIPLDGPPPPWLAKTISSSSLRLPEGLCAGRIGGFIDSLEKAHPFPSWEASPALRGELVLILNTDNTATLGDYSLNYDRNDGFTYIEEKRNERAR